MSMLPVRLPWHTAAHWLWHNADLSIASAMHTVYWHILPSHFAEQPEQHIPQHTCCLLHGLCLPSYAPCYTTALPSPHNALQAPHLHT
jgi:hypothetical protein